MLTNGGKAQRCRTTNRGRTPDYESPNGVKDLLQLVCLKIHKLHGKPCLIDQPELPREKRLPVTNNHLGKRGARLMRCRQEAALILMPGFSHRHFHTYHLAIGRHSDHAGKLTPVNRARKKQVVLIGFAVVVMQMHGYEPLLKPLEP